jgi:hypothetical protein
MPGEEEAYNLTASRLRELRKRFNPGDIVDAESGLDVEDLDRLISRIHIRSRVPYAGPERRNVWSTVDLNEIRSLDPCELIDVFSDVDETYETVSVYQVDWFSIDQRPLVWRRNNPARRKSDRSRRGG